MQNVQSSSFYPHETLALDETDPSSISDISYTVSRLYLTCDLAADTLVVCRFYEAFILVMLALETVFTSVALTKS